MGALRKAGVWLGLVEDDDERGLRAHCAMTGVLARRLVAEDDERRRTTTVPAPRAARDVATGRSGSDRCADRLSEAATTAADRSPSPTAWPTGVADRSGSTGLRAPRPPRSA